MVARLNRNLGKCDNPTIVVMTLQGGILPSCDHVALVLTAIIRVAGDTKFNRVAVETFTLAIRMGSLLLEPCHVTIQRYNGDDPWF